MDFLNPDALATLALLIGLELVLGVDNVLVISILVGRLPEEKRNGARMLGLSFAMIGRLFMLWGIVWLTKLEAGLVWHLSAKDLLFLGGGMFLLWKAVKEIHHTVELIEEPGNATHAPKSMVGSIVMQIVLLDIVFSMDSVITAVGLAEQIWVIVIAVIFSFALILVFARAVGDFILRHPSVKILALAFMVTIGVTIILEGLHQHVPKTYIYLPMGFALGVDMLQMRFDHNRKQRLARKAGAQGAEI